MKKYASYISAVMLASALAVISAAALTACGELPEEEVPQRTLYEETYPTERMIETTVLRKDPASLRAFAIVYAAVPEQLSSIPLYADPDNESDVVTQLMRNDAVSVLEKQEGWLHVRFGAHTGWLQTSSVSSFILETEPEETEPVPTDYYVILPDENSIAVIYRNADPASEQLLEPAQGMKLELVDTEAPDGWYHVSCGDVTGYIRAEYVTTEEPPPVETTETSTATTQTETTTVTTVTELPQTAPPATTAPPPASTSAPPASNSQHVQFDTTMLIPSSDLWSFVSYPKAANMQMHITDLVCSNGNATASYYDRIRGHCDSVTAIYVTGITPESGMVAIAGTIEITELRTSAGQTEPESVVIDQIPFSLTRYF